MKKILWDLETLTIRGSDRQNPIHSLVHFGNLPIIYNSGIFNLLFTTFGMAPSMELIAINPNSSHQISTRRKQLLNEKDRI